jgi:hypothetical protein
MGKVVVSSEVSAWAIVALAARVLAVSLAVVGPAVFGVPSAFRLDAPWTHEILATTRAAAVAHALVILIAHAVSMGGGSEALWTSRREKGGVVAATARIVSALAIGTVFWFVLAASFGVSALGKPSETAHLALLLASLTCVPGAARHGLPLDASTARTWGAFVTSAGARRVAGGGGGNRKDASTSSIPSPNIIHLSCGADLVWILGGWGASLGAWCGAMVIPLDWDRAWQRWPTSCARGATCGFAAGAVWGFSVALSRRFGFGTRSGTGTRRNEEEKKTR